MLAENANLQEKFDLAKYAMIKTVDLNCENTNRNCYTCKKVHKCEVCFIKEALGRIVGYSRTIDNSEFVKLKRWSMDYYANHGGT